MYSSTEVSEKFSEYDYTDHNLKLRVDFAKLLYAVLFCVTINTVLVLQIMHNEEMKCVQLSNY